MSNPWMKKNPFMSMWLSGANSIANTARAGSPPRQSASPHGDHQGAPTCSGPGRDSPGPRRGSAGRDVFLASETPVARIRLSPGRPLHRQPRGDASGCARGRGLDRRRPRGPATSPRRRGDWFPGLVLGLTAHGATRLPPARYQVRRAAAADGDAARLRPGCNSFAASTRMKSWPRGNASSSSIRSRIASRMPRMLDLVRRPVGASPGRAGPDHAGGGQVCVRTPPTAIASPLPACRRAQAWQRCSPAIRIASALSPCTRVSRLAPRIRCFQRSARCAATGAPRRWRRRRVCRLQSGRP